MVERTDEGQSPERLPDAARRTLPTVVSRTVLITVLSATLCYGSYLIFDLPYWTEPSAMILPVLAPLVTAPWFIHAQTKANAKLSSAQAALRMREAQLIREIEERRTAETRAVAEREKAQIARERAEIERERAEEASRTKSRFLSNVSHEIRTPLNSIVGFSELLHTEPLDEKVQAEYAGHVFDASCHLLALINDILDLARIEAGKTELVVEELDAAQEAERATAMIEGQASAKQIALQIELTAGDLTLRADRRILVQMLLNLLSNAVNYTPAGGIVSVSGRRTADATVELSVTDTGPGMSADQIERMLQPFERGDGLQEENRAGGTGLGLSLVKSLMEKHGGRLLVESEPGSGTRATLSFPPSRTDRKTA